MKMLKPTMIILIAATLVILATLPLAQTEWADGLREAFANQLEGTEKGEGPSSALRYVLPFVKELLFIGIPGAILIVILRLKKRFMYWKRNV